MQSGIQSSPTWTQLAFYILASFIGGGGAYKLFNVWLNRNKPKAEVHESIARAGKTKAEARKIDVESEAQSASTVARITLRLERMQIRTDEILQERDEYKRRVDLQEIELAMRDSDIKKLKGILDSRGIKISDYDAVE
jgi:hypothetical protein